MKNMMKNKMMKKLFIFAFVFATYIAAAQAAQLPDLLCFNLFYGQLCFNATNVMWNKNGTSAYYVGGNVGIGTTDPQQELEINGDIRLDANGAATTNGLCHSGANSDTTFSDRDIVACSGAPGDIAEWYDTLGAGPGDVVVAGQQLISFNSPNVDALTGILLGSHSKIRVAKFEKSSRPFQTNVVGIVSSSPAQSYGRAIIEIANNPQPIALVGMVPTKVSTENGPINIGDLLTTSSIPGHAMKFDTISATTAKTIKEIADIIDENELRRNSIIGKALEPCNEKTCLITVMVSLQ